MYATPYRCCTRRYNLCLTEKYIIARTNQNNILNKRTELISKCRQRNKYMLKSIGYILNRPTMEKFKYPIVHQLQNVSYNKGILIILRSYRI